jgi:hypothetical protein
LASLMLVDVAVGWIELEAIWGKGQQRVRAGVHQARRRLPLPLREWHTDNGGEFINQVLYPYCRKEGIQVTRGRPYKKNDQAYVEQKNWSVVRRVVGYDRYTSKAALAALQEVYEPLRLYMNFFQPLRKLIGKERVGAKVRKRYDRAQTAYQRLSAAGVLEPSQAERLHRQYLSLNPVRLRSDIDAALRNLWRLADRGLAKEEAKRVACG